jgi:glycogen debranching enzyme
MQDDMFSGWGVRTLSAGEAGYNPLAYHRGTVWPHDNALVAAGLRRYGHDEAARRIYDGIFQAATHFELHRMPEVFSGFPAAPYGEPVRYPVACHPQAWAAGSLPMLLATMLGLEPDGFNRRLVINRPLLPEPVNELTLTGLAVGDASVDLRFRRVEDGVALLVLQRRGDLAVIQQAAPPSAEEL